MQIKLHDNRLVQAFQVIFEYIWIELYQPRQHIQKQRHYFANKGPSSQGYFPVVMYGCDTWTVKKAERQRIHAFELNKGLLESLGLQGDPTSPF